MFDQLFFCSIGHPGNMVFEPDESRGRLGNASSLRVLNSKQASIL